MSYETQWKLTYDDEFVSRSKACEIQQADIQFRNDANLANAALANAVLRSEPAVLQAFQVQLPATPGFSDKLDEKGEIDSSLIIDAELLAAVQASWPGIAGLFFNDDGTPIETVPLT
jgi:hypothetical protein